MTKRLHFHFSFLCIGEGNGNPLQCSCLENPRYRGACWAAVYGVAQSWTRLKRLSSSSNSRKIQRRATKLIQMGGKDKDKLVVFFLDFLSWTIINPHKCCWYNELPYTLYLGSPTVNILFHELFFCPVFISLFIHLQLYPYITTSICVCVGRDRRYVFF